VPFIAKEKVSPVPGNCLGFAGGEQRVESLRRGAAGQSDAEPALILHCLGCQAHKLARCGTEEFRCSIQDAEFCAIRHENGQLALQLAAQRAAPIRAVLSLVMTLTGIDSISPCMRPLLTKTRMN